MDPIHGFYTCDTCGALVTPVTMDHHSDWHDKLEESLENRHKE